MRRANGSALLEFAIAWPVALLLVAGSVQLAVWGSEAYSARQAALAGARAGSAADGTAALAESAALRLLQPALVGTSAGAWCPGAAGARPAVWVCAVFSTARIEVRIGGAVPALVPLLPGGGALPVEADVGLAREVFR